MKFYVLTCSESNEDTELKFYYFSTWDSNISALSAADGVKLNAFNLLFNVGQTTLQEVLYATSLLLDPDNPSLDLTPAAVLQIVDGTALAFWGESVRKFSARSVDNASSVLTAALDNRRKASYAEVRFLIYAASGGVASSLPSSDITVLIKLLI